MSAPVRMLFVKKSSRLSGGHLKFREYFGHAERHPAIEPFAYLAFEAKAGPGELWQDVAGRLVPSLEPSDFDLIFVDATDAALLPSRPLPAAIHLMQDFRHTYPADRRFMMLERPALRICVSQELADAVRPLVDGPVVAIPNGIPDETFCGEPKVRGSVLIWARKDPELGDRLGRSLRAVASNVQVLKTPVSRTSFAKLLARADIFVGLPKGIERGWEGFFLPSVEAMASGCVVVCADALGNRSHCIDGVTCLMPQFGDLADHERAVREVLTCQPLADGLRVRGRKMSEQFTLERERQLFYEFLDEHQVVKSPSGAHLVDIDAGKDVLG